MSRPTAAISSSVRASLQLGLAADHAVCAWPSSRPSATLSSAACDRRDLGQDVDAVAILLDHPLDAAHLPLDAREALLQLVLLAVYPRGGVRLRVLMPTHYDIPPRGYRYDSFEWAMSISKSSATACGTRS